MFTAAERGELWRRHEAGESTHGIGRALGRANPVIYGMHKRAGGITPPERYRSSRVLSLVEARRSRAESSLATRAAASLEA
jgi:hypothetical protein